MLTQLQEERSAFTSTVYFSWDSRKRQFGKTARSSFTCTPTFIKGVQTMHKVCGTDRPMDSIKDRSCKFGSWWPEMGKPVPVLTGFPFSCQCWPWSTPKTSLLAPSLSDITDVMWSQSSFCKKCTRSWILAAVRAHRMETELKNKNHNVDMEFYTAGQSSKIGSIGEKELLLVHEPEVQSLM